jgi:hypothetical protein
MSWLTAWFGATAAVDAKVLVYGGMPAGRAEEKNE